MKFEEEYYGITATNYENRRKDMKDWNNEEAALQKIISELSVVGHKKLCILDLPCGTGRWIPHLKPIADTYFGVDISKDMIAEAKKKITDIEFPCNFFEDTWLDYLTRTEDKVDLIISTRFLMSWDKKTSRNILELMAQKSQRFLILEIRITESRIEQLKLLFSMLIFRPKRILYRLKNYPGNLTKSQLKTFYLNLLKKYNYSLKKEFLIKESNHSKLVIWFLESNNSTF
jgi:SAM-dependent methyltransferase